MMFALDLAGSVELDLDNEGNQHLAGLPCKSDEHNVPQHADLTCDCKSHRKSLRCVGVHVQFPALLDSTRCGSIAHNGNISSS